MRTRIWKRLLQPTLMRRMLLGQMLLLTVLWSLLVAFVIYDGHHDRGLLHTDSIYDAFITAADSLADQPDRRDTLIRNVDRMLQYAYDPEPEKNPGLLEIGPGVVIIQGGKIIYRSEHVPASLHSTKLNEIEKIDIDGMHWYTRSRQSTKTDTRVTLAEPKDPVGYFLVINQRGYYLIPLILALPFLILPAWLSIRIGLKPWTRVAREVAERGPQDLTPLSIKPKHLELRSMVDNINMLLGRVEESALRERSFIADAAHELRTPLAAMRINVEALQQQQHNVAQRSLLNGIINSSDRATRLVSQLLQMMRSEATGQIGMDRLALHILLQDRLAVLSALGLARNIELELLAQQPIWIMGRREGLESLIANLVENAVKFSPENGIVTVSLTRVGAQAVLHVADQGPGIPKALRERVFDRFFRAPDQSESGSGLGLAIAQSVAQQHGGKIFLGDAPGGSGLLVAVTLPSIIL
ncbi:ATP-binding protein [Glaciimonas sp. GG7]